MQNQINDFCCNSAELIRVKNLFKDLKLLAKASVS